jgi:(p)ppGpp synthase/HD superfamily hydrolase
MKNFLKLARQFAIDAHTSIDHRRKYTNEPYHIHPARVAKIVSNVTSDKDMIAAAWLHDVLEDVAPKNPEFNEEAILRLFGKRTLRLVLEVTDVAKPEDGNREQRKLINREHLANASKDGKTIKLADLIDNTIDISKNDPDFYRIFKKEIMLDLPYLSEGNSVLFERLTKLLE